MADVESPEFKQLIAERLKIQDQLLLFSEFRITGLPAEKWTPYFRTNNFIQRSLSILLGFNSSVNEFQLIGVDSSNRMRFKGEVGSTDGTSDGTLKFLRTDSGGRLLVSSEEDLKEDITLIDDVTVAESGTATHAGVDVGMHTEKTLLVETNRSMTVYMQGSTDNVNFYDLKTIADADVSHNCNNEKILISVPFYCHFFRVLIQNTAGGSGLVTARLMGHA